MRRQSLAHVGAFPNLTRLGCEGLLAHAPRPGRRDHAHAKDALGRAQEIHPAGDRPPAVTGLLEKVEALQPFLLGEGRDVAIQAPTGDLEAEQREPILEPVERDEIAGPGHRLRAAEIPFGPQQAERIEAGDDRATLPVHPVQGAVDDSAMTTIIPIPAFADNYISVVRDGAAAAISTCCEPSLRTRGRRRQRLASVPWKVRAGQA